MFLFKYSFTILILSHKPVEPGAGLTTMSSNVNYSHLPAWFLVHNSEVISQVIEMDYGCPKVQKREACSSVKSGTSMFAM